MPSLDIKIAGEEPAVPQILKIDAIWVVAVQVATETLESSAEKAGFCNMPKDPDWPTLDKKMLNKENGYYLPLNSEFAPHREDLKRDLELSSTSEKASEHLLGWGNVSANVGGAIGGNAATAGALTGVALMTKAIFGTNGYVDPTANARHLLQATLLGFTNHR